MPVAAIVLAAGSSSRLGQPKQLLEYIGETLLGRAIRLCNEAGAAPVFAVLGAHHEIVSASISFGSAIPILNGLWEQGIASSIHSGLNALDAALPDAAGALVLTCDQPRLAVAHLRTLLAAFSEQPAPTIVASTYAGTLGVPAVFPRIVFPDLRALCGDKGARSLLAKPPCPLIAIEFPGGEVDIDVPADLAQLE